MTIPTSVRFDEETMKKLDSLAQGTGRSKSFYIKKMVEENVDRIMWEYNILATAEAVRTGKEKLYTLEEASKILGLDD